MATTSQQLDSERAAALAAVDRGDYTTAIVHANKALLILATIPDSKIDRSELSWDRAAIVEFIKQCRALQATMPAAAGSNPANMAQAYTVEYGGYRCRGDRH